MKKYKTTITIDLETRNTQAIDNLIDQIKKPKCNILSLKITNTTPNPIETPDDEKTTQKRKLQKLRNTQRKILKTIINQLDYKPTNIDYEPETWSGAPAKGYKAIMELKPQENDDDWTRYYSPSIIIDDSLSKIIIQTRELSIKAFKTFDLADPNFIYSINKYINEIIPTCIDNAKYMIMQLGKVEIPK